METIILVYLLPQFSQDDDRTRALRLVPVSRETEARFSLFVDRLRRWQAIKNLVAPSTLSEVWTRHIADSAQLIDWAPDAKTWVDLGSGGGFPGLVVALQWIDRPGAMVHLVESDHRKCAFLREVIRETQAPAQVHASRIDSIVPALAGRGCDVVSARALAPLAALLRSADSLLMTGAVGLFPKGRHFQAELTEAAILPTPYRIDCVASRVDPESRIIRVRRAQGTDG